MPPFIRLWRNHLIRRQNHPLHAGNCVSVEYERVMFATLFTAGNDIGTEDGVVSIPVRDPTEARADY